MMLAEVVIPYRSHGYKRDRCLQLVRDHLHASPYPLHIVDAPGDWSPAAARNAGALCIDAPVVVFNDADTVVPVSQLVAAAEAAAANRGLVYAYTLYLRCDEQSTLEMYATDRDPALNPDILRFERELYQPVSVGCCAIQVECLRLLNGFNEEYVGWGYEDSDFAQRSAALWPIRRIPGPAYHLWHGARRDDDAPRDSDPAEVAANLDRYTGRTAGDQAAA